MKIYIAGPDVFRTDARAWADEVYAQCAAHGCEALIPLDGGETTAAGIYAKNIEMIRAADVVIANLNPFRGAEPDSGTCFEVGFALALGKRVIAYVESEEPLKNRVMRMRQAGKLDDAMQIEDFNLPLNLMLAVSVKLKRSFVEALSSAIAQGVVVPAKAGTQ